MVTASPAGPKTTRSRSRSAGDLLRSSIVPTSPPWRRRHRHTQSRHSPLSGSASWLECFTRKHELHTNSSGCLGRTRSETSDRSSGSATSSSSASSSSTTRRSFRISSRLASTSSSSTSSSSSSASSAAAGTGAATWRRAPPPGPRPPARPRGRRRGRRQVVVVDQGVVEVLLVETSRASRRRRGPRARRCRARRVLSLHPGRRPLLPFEVV